MKTDSFRPTDKRKKTVMFEQVKFDSILNEIGDAISSAENATTIAEHTRLTNWVNSLLEKLEKCEAVTANGESTAIGSDEFEGLILAND